MNTRKKWLSVIIALVMLVTNAIPFAALATGDTDELIDFNSKGQAADVAEPAAEIPSGGGTEIEFIESAPAEPANTVDNAGDNATDRSETAPDNVSSDAVANDNAGSEGDVVNDAPPAEAPVVDEAPHENAGASADEVIAPVEPVVEPEEPEVPA